MNRSRTSLLLCFAALLPACGGSVAPDRDPAPGASPATPKHDVPPAAPAATPAPGPSDTPLAAEVIADDVETPTALAVDADGVYWTTLGAGGLGRVRSWSKSSHALAVVADGQPGPAALAASGGTLYWANTATGSGAIMSAPAHGGATVTLTMADAATALAPDGGVVYILEEHGGGIISTVPKTGGEKTFVAQVGDATQLAYDGQSLFFLTGQVMTVPASGGFPARVSETCFYPVTLAVDDTDAFFGCQDGTLRAAAKIGGGASRTLFRRDVSAGSISGLALDANNVYFTSTSDGTVNRVSKKGGIVTALASGEGSVGPIAVDSTTVYFATQQVAGAKSAVKRVAK